MKNTASVEEAFLLLLVYLHASIASEIQHLPVQAPAEFPNTVKIPLPSQAFQVLLVNQIQVQEPAFASVAL